MNKKKSYAESKARAFEKFAVELEKNEFLSDEDRINILEYWYERVFENEKEEEWK
ncbi:hypothetical protein [Halalkalibacter okhensis]|uniref:hypothetical protein n=1 Tax=Halalkalibacter okhensis TaxID=333138 RepID=UPI001377CA47|nr:hypothetical protein [Halalkalibacter okhensis]